MQQYEFLGIISPSYTDEEMGQIEQKVLGVFSKGGATVRTTRRLGKLKFAYPIKKQRYGNYLMVLLSAEPQAIREMERVFRLTPELLRYVIVKDAFGEEQKFQLEQFVEVDVEAREIRRRERMEGREARGPVKTAHKEKEVAETEKRVTPTLSTQEVEQKIEQALQADMEKL